MNRTVKASALREILKDPEMMEIARLAVEDELMEWRDAMRFVSNRNGFAILNRDGSPSNVIRLSTVMGLHTALNAMADRLEGKC